MICYFSDEPVIRTMSADQSGIARYTVKEVTGMQNDTILAGNPAYTGDAFCPDGFEDLELGGLLRSMLSDQERNIRTLQYRNAQDCSVTQGTFIFNTYFSVTDASSGITDDYSILYDTRGITAEESGCTYHYQPYHGYVANYFPEREITEGQYFSLMYRQPSNYQETMDLNLMKEYAYVDSSMFNVLAHEQVASLTGQSFRYSGNVDWQAWSDSHGAIWLRFYIENEKQEKTYLTPRLYPKWCEDPDNVYLYWVNSMGGVDFVRGKITKSLNHEDSTYESNTGINDRMNGRERIYHQLKWNSYSFGTSIISDDDSPSIADICGARWAWLCIPEGMPVWRPVKVTDSKATVKSYRNQGAKLFNYTFELEDATKYKSV